MDLTYCFNKIFNEGTLDEALAKSKNSQKDVFNINERNFEYRNAM